MQRLLFLFLLLTPVLLKAEPLEIFVSVPPLKTFVEKVAGPHANVNTMVGPGHNPATYEPGPKQIRQLADTRYYLRIGVPFENAWMQRIQSANPAMQIIDVREGIQLRTLEQHHHAPDHGDHHGHDDTGYGVELDPHVWTSPRLVMHILENIEKLLAAALPRHSDEFARNRRQYSMELEELDQSISNTLRPLNSRRFLVFHPSWGYFAERYQLEQVAIEYQGKEPGARTLTSLINRAIEENIRVIFVQPQFSRKSAQQVAHAINGRVIAIDPLAADYVDNMHRVAQQMMEAIQ